MARLACVWALAAAIVLTLMSEGVQGRGRMLQPYSRSSVWRHGPPWDGSINFADDMLDCGGYDTQYKTNHGKCGVCGDPYNGPWENEPGGKYALGIITADITENGEIPVFIQIMDNKMGWFEFRLCDNDMDYMNVTQECFDEFLLKDAKSDTSRFDLQKGVGNYSYTLQAPLNVTCLACVLQWKWNTAGSMGTDSSGKSCMGCGNQVQYYGCADIAIGYEGIQLGKKAQMNDLYYTLLHRNKMARDRAEAAKAAQTGKSKGKSKAKSSGDSGVLSLHPTSHLFQVLSGLLSLLAWAPSRK